MVLTYPLPFDQWQTFEPFVRRFTDTFKKFPPGCDYRLYANCCWGGPTDAIKEMFYGIKTLFLPYYFNGCDIGSAQQVANAFAEDVFMVNFTSRCYFHRECWLARYAQAREKHGPGLYGASTSWEGGKAHICTRAYALDSELFRNYPHVIDERAKGQRFEVGDWCLTEWVQRDYPAIQVTWDREMTLAESRCKEETGIFRRGEQNAMLVLDKHTDWYRDADEAEKKRLSDMADGIT